MSPEERRRSRFEQIERFLASGMRASHWCGLNGMNSSTFYMWLSKYREEQMSRQLDELQGKKATTEWISLSRQELKEQTALAVRENPPASEPAPGPCAQAPEPSIGIRLNGAVLSVPAGARREDIANALAAVASL